MFYTAKTGNEYILNLIDTPNMWILLRSRARRREGALLVDAAQGVEANRANVYLALDNNLVILPVINKIDLPSARPEEVKKDWNYRLDGNRAAISPKKDKY